MVVPETFDHADPVHTLPAWLRRGQGRIHMLGVGGVGMAGLAFHLHHQGFEVTGCDAVPNPLLRWLEGEGVPVAHGHAPGHVDASCDLVVRSTAVPADHPELEQARARDVPVLRRGEVLPALATLFKSAAVTGTHGKTTTTAMLAEVLRTAGCSPSSCIGGETVGRPGVAERGSGDWLVVEADESDGTARHYQPDVAVITNVEYDHMEHFDSENAFFECFDLFTRNTKGPCIYCLDDPHARRILRGHPQACSYGFTEGADVQGLAPDVRAGTGSCDVRVEGKVLGRLSIMLPGRHNLLNALGACAAAFKMGLPFAAIQQGLRSCRGVRRRFEKIASPQGITVISDYAHHPTEVAAVVQSARQFQPRKLVAVFQPHRYTRTRALGRDFPQAFSGLDRLVLVPVYAASEEPLPGGRSEDLYRHCREQEPGLQVDLTENLEEGWRRSLEGLAAGDMLMILGAGDIEVMESWARDRWPTQTTATTVN